MNILVTGASGLLGSNLLLAARERGVDVAAVRHKVPVELPGVETVAADLSEFGSLNAAVDRLRPDWIFHCAAATDVDWCEANPVEAGRVNVQGARVVADAAARVDAGMLLVSTDSVFDGRRGGYTEGDETAPLNVYARTKDAAEEVVVGEGLSRYLVVRSNLFGWNAQDKTSLAEWIVRELSAGRRIRGFADVIFAPLLVNDLAAVLLDLAAGDESGIFHAASTPAVSKLEFARKVAGVFGLDRSLIDEGRLEGAALKAARPLNTALDASLLWTTLGRPAPDLDDSLRRFRALRENGYAARLKALVKGQPA